MDSIIGMTIAAVAFLRLALVLGLVPRLLLYHTSCHLKRYACTMRCETYSPGPAPPHAQRRQDLFLAPSSPRPQVEPVQLPPLIHHIRADRLYRTVVDCIRCETGLNDRLILDLIRFGAVYYGEPGPRLQARRLDLTQINLPCHPDAYLRVHVHPRRYRAAQYLSPAQWTARLLSGQEFVVLDKPPGIPSQPTVDNSIENCLFMVQQCLSSTKNAATDTSDSELCSTSRLDACTAGLLIFARGRRAANTFHALLRERPDNNRDVRLEKKYRVLTRCAPPKDMIIPQRVRHWFPVSTRQRPPERRANDDEHHGDPLDTMVSTTRSTSRRHSNAKPTLLKNFDNDSSTSWLDNDSDEINWQIAELTVLSCRPLSSSSEVDLKAFPCSSISPGSPGRDVLYEWDVQLLTGRTHQIRLQFAALGCPVLGDTRYEPVAGLLYEGPFSTHGDGSRLFGREPSV